MTTAVVVATIGVTVAACSALIALAALRRASEAVRESFRARIDLTAPRLAVRVKPPTSVRLGDNSDVTARAVPWEGLTMDLAREPSRPIYLRTWAELTNEGRSSAFLELPAAATPVGRPDEDPIETLNPRWSMFGRRAQSQPLTLAPEESRWIFLEVSLPFQNWAALLNQYDGDDELHAAMRRCDDQAAEPIIIRSSDQYGAGVEDTVTIRIGGLPVRPQTPGSSTYAFVSGPSLYFVVDRSRRAYPKLQRRSWRRRTASAD